MNLLHCSVAVVTGPLFGSPWLALLAIVIGIAAFMFAVAAVGRWLAATHPEPSKAPADASASPIAVPATAAKPEIPSGEVLAIIAAAVRVTFGASARIARVIPTKPAAPNVETLMQQWSMEGRRQIYSSHQIR